MVIENKDSDKSNQCVRGYEADQAIISVSFTKNKQQCYLVLNCRVTFEN